MNKLFLIIVLLVSSACACFAKDTQSELAFALNKDAQLTLKYYICSKEKDYFMRIRLITRSDDVMKEGDVLTFICKDGSRHSITFDKDYMQNTDEEGFRAASVDIPTLAHMLTKIDTIRLEHDNYTYDMELLKYTNYKTIHAIEKIVEGLVEEELNSLFKVIDNLKMQEVNDFHYIESQGFKKAFEDYNKKNEKISQIKQNFYFAKDMYKLKKKQQKMK